MNYPSAIGYSIWLEFDTQNASLIKQIIENLSSKYNSPLFDPHLTLLPGIKDDEKDLILKFSHFVTNLNSFSLEIENIEHSDEFYKCVFLKVKSSYELMNLFSKSIEYFRNDEEKVFYPHISLIYSYLSINERMKILDEIRVYQFNKYDVKKISLVRTAGKPSEWKHVITFNLS